MLVISRKLGETIVIGDNIVLTVVEVRGDKVRLGVRCPVDVPVHRHEVYQAITGIQRPEPPPRARPPQELAFVQAVLEDPDDEGIRLIFADWLEERGDPYGEFIRVQCELAKLPAGDERRRELARRERALWAEHGEGWRAYLPRVLWPADFERGFVESASLTVAEFLDKAEAIFAAAPLRRLRVRPAWPVAFLHASPYLARLAELDLSGVGVGDAGAAALAASPHLANLRLLDLSGNALGEAAAAALRARFGDRVRL